MNKNNKNIVLIGVLAVLVITFATYVGTTKTTSPDVIITKQLPPTPTQSIVAETKTNYNNIQYGFTFILPIEWAEYSIGATQWNGTMVTTQEKVTGPKIVIRDPRWTAQTPRQDIPILVLTKAQWSLVQQEKMAIGAAPVAPSELGENSKYVFALPERYNFAFLTGFEEVKKIIDGKPLKGY